MTQIDVTNMSSPRIILPEDCSAFKNFYPNGELRITNPKEINPMAMEGFEQLSRRFISPQKYSPGDFHQFFIVKKINFGEIHIAYQTKLYSEGVEGLLYLQDLNESGSDVGEGEVRFEFTDREEVPFVGYTGTPLGLQRQGRGTDRLSLMNGLTRLLFGLPLYSSQFHKGFPIKASEKAWKRQVKARRAIRENLDEGRGHRYHFI